jgi:hypothetical protein
MKLMADYVTFPAAESGGTASSPSSDGKCAADNGIPATAQLKRDMKMGEVSNLFGPGKQMSQSVSPDGLKTQVLNIQAGTGG